MHLEVEAVAGEGQDAASTYATSEETDLELVSYCLPGKLPHVSNRLVFDPSYPLAHEVSVAEKEEVHGFVAAAGARVEKDAANRRNPSSMLTRGS